MTARRFLSEFSSTPSLWKVNEMKRALEVRQAPILRLHSKLTGLRAAAFGGKD
jgi:hypothetical protein